MELPKVGEHCGARVCKRLDFLPMRCYGCNRNFCDEHVTYEAHDCPSKHLQNKEVPTCPICGAEVALRVGQTLDAAVNEHINHGCAKKSGKGKTYVNACKFKGCKKREVMPLTCQKCGRNFCLAHRFETDHNCQGRAGRATQQQEAIAKRTESKKPVAKQSSSKRSMTPAATMSAGRSAALARPGGMSEDEALQLAMAQSMEEERVRTRAGAGGHSWQPEAMHPPSSAADADLELALAMSASLAETSKPKSKPKSEKSDCSMQ
eukprot:m.586233 g.586233  ORF g.586233 m.586233 type:complete len:263 (-) comp22341_c0_seq3:113-901(-)